MIQILNNIINNILIGLKYLIYIFSIICFIILYPLLISLHKWKKRIFTHPHFVLFNWIVGINKTFKKIIF